MPSRKLCNDKFENKIIWHINESKFSFAHGRHLLVAFLLTLIISLIIHNIVLWFWCKKKYK